MGVQYTLTILACLSALLVPVPYLFFKYGKLPALMIGLLLLTRVCRSMDSRKVQVRYQGQIIELIHHLASTMRSSVGVRRSLTCIRLEHTLVYPTLYKALDHTPQTVETSCGEHL